MAVIWILLLAAILIFIHLELKGLFDIIFPDNSRGQQKEETHIFLKLKKK